MNKQSHIIKRAHTNTLSSLHKHTHTSVWHAEVSVYKCPLTPNICKHTDRSTQKRVSIYIQLANIWESKAFDFHMHILLVLRLWLCYVFFTAVNFLFAQRVAEPISILFCTILVWFTFCAWFFAAYFFIFNCICARVCSLNGVTCKLFHIYADTCKLFLLEVNHLHKQDLLKSNFVHDLTELTLTGNISLCKKSISKGA